MTKFELTAKQLEAQRIIAGDATHVMLFGGSRSGKTFLHIRNVVMRALKAPSSRHLIARYRFGHVKTSVGMDTLPKVMSLCYPGIPYELSKTDWYVTLPNASEVWLGGLDDKERTEKILGQEYATVFLNECSQISWAAREMVMTRLAQLAQQVIDDRPGAPLKLRAYYDCNPPSKGHWTHLLFRQHLDPITRSRVAHPEQFVSCQMNPRDNLPNLSPEYLQTLEGLSPRMRRRFLDGEFADENPGALFSEADIDRWRADSAPARLVRVVVAVDPSGSGDEDNADNDEIGIVVAGLGSDGIAYVLEDLTIKAGPGTWGDVAVSAYQRHQADAIVAETNFGGAMVAQTIRVAGVKAGVRPNYKAVTASRGKVQRAEPFSALYEQGKVRHVGILPRLEDELCGFSANGYTGQGSPNRADAAIWALAELFPAITSGPRLAAPITVRNRWSPLR